MAAELIFHYRSRRILESANGIDGSEHQRMALDTPPLIPVQPDTATTQELMTSSTSEMVTSQSADLSKPVSGSEVITSTPVKSEDIPASVALLASKMHLLDQPPHILLLDIYREFYEYFGDSIAMRLPIRHIENRYIKKKVNFEVHLGDEDSKRSGEELLKIFMETSAVNVTQEHSEMEIPDEDSKSVNSEFEPTPDDIDIDMDEKSDLSYRSDRSDDHSFLGNDSGKIALTVKTTVNDPALGIKLKFSKIKPLPPPEPKPEKVEKIEKPKSDSKHSRKRKQSLKPVKLPEIFERVPLQRNRQFVFNVDGVTQMAPREKLTEKLPGGCSWSVLNSDYRRMSSNLSPFGKNRNFKKTKKHRTGFFNIML